MFDQIVRYLRKRRSRRHVHGQPAAAPEQLGAVSVEEDASTRDAPESKQEVSQYSASQNTIMDPFTLRGMPNRFALINTLPDELLVHILLFIRIWPHWSSKGFDPVRYMQVCRHWCTVILDHGHFWDTIVVHKRTERLLLSLSRSHQVLLHLTFEDLPTLASVLLHVVPCRGRIKSLVLGYGSRDELAALSPLIDGVFPSLAKLVIKDHGIPISFPAPAVDQILFLPANCPQLAHLELARIRVQLTRSLLRGLTTLSLTHCTLGLSKITADAFLDTLESAQCIENLNLDRYASAACSQLPSPSRHSVSLPRLRNLEFIDDVQWVRQFITFVRLPPRGCVYLCGWLSSDELDEAVIHHWKLLLPLQLHGSAFLGATDSLSICRTFRYGEETFHCTAGPLDVKLSLVRATLRGWGRTIVPATTILPALADLLRPSALKTLSLSIDIQAASRAIFDNLFDTVPHLTSLHITTPYGEDAHLLEPHLLESLASGPSEDAVAIDAGSDSAPQRVRVRCPVLEHLVLGGFSWDGGIIMAAVVDCLRTRTTLGAEPLQRLCVSVKPDRTYGEGWMDAYYAAQLREMVGKFQFAVSNHGLLLLH